MRYHRLGAALAGLVFADGVASAQFGGPPGGDRERGGDRGPRGMFGGGMPDPNTMWGFIARDPNAVSINLNDRPDIKQRMIDRGQAVPPDGILTKEAFVVNMQQRMASGQFGSPPGAGGPPGMSFSFGGDRGRGSSSFDPNTMTEEQLREAMGRYDRDKDGRISAEEGSRSDKMRERFAQLDTNRDGFLDMAEYKGYLAMRMAERQAEDASRGSSSASMSTPGAPPGFPGFVPPGGSPTPGQPQEEERPVAYRFGKLPKEVPSWFEKYDTDQDGQVGLYEWRAANEPTAKFVEMDQTGDGYLTADEWVRFTRMALEKKPDEGSSDAAPSGGSRGVSPVGMSGRNPFAGGGPPGSSGGSDGQGGDRRRGFFSGSVPGSGGPSGPGGPSRGGRDRDREKDKDKSDKK